MDKTLKHSTLYIAVSEQGTRSCKIAGMTCPFDTRVVEKKKEKEDNRAGVATKIRNKEDFAL